MTNLNKQKRALYGLLFLSLLLLGMRVNAQMRIGGVTEPDPSAILDLNPDAGDNATKGLALPRLKLVSTTDAAPLTAHVKGMYVYNVATTAGANSVTPGMYYNDGSRWIKIAAEENNTNVKTLEIVLNETIGVRSKTFFGTTATATSPITIVSIEPQLTGDPVMIGALLKVNAMANLNNSATVINWSVAIENDNIEPTRTGTLTKVIISYISDGDFGNASNGAYSIAGR